MPAILVTCIGLLAQAFFSARTLVQWILSEKARRVLSPTVFWVLSLCGSALLALYGWLRQDFAVVAGQMVSYYVYVWNLHIKRVKMPGIAWGALTAFPLVAMTFVASQWDTFVAEFLMRSDVPRALLICGTFGQLLLTLRFVYQWLYSSKRGRSELPSGFWWISLTGASIVFVYGILRSDIVLMLGQGFGLVVYLRNLVLSKRTLSA